MCVLQCVFLLCCPLGLKGLDASHPGPEIWTVLFSSGVLYRPFTHIFQAKTRSFHRLCAFTLQSVRFYVCASPLLTAPSIVQVPSRQPIAVIELQIFMEKCCCLILHLPCTPVMQLLVPSWCYIMWELQACMHSYWGITRRSIMASAQQVVVMLPAIIKGWRQGKCPGDHTAQINPRYSLPLPSKKGFFSGWHFQPPLRPVPLTFCDAGIREGYKKHLCSMHSGHSVCAP